MVVYTHELVERAGPLAEDSTDGYFAREIMPKGLALVSFFDDCHPYPTIFLNVVERLVRLLLVHEGALAVDKKEWSAL